MKKIFIAIVSLLLLSTLVVYLFIPKKVVVSRVTLMHANDNQVARFLSNMGLWEKWWPEKSSGKGLCLDDACFELTGNYYRLQNVLIKTKTANYPGNIKIIGLPNDSSLIRWDLNVETGINPFNRVSKYFAAVELSKKIDSVTAHFKSYIEKTESVYGVELKIGTIRMEDTLMLYCKTLFDDYPNASQVFQLFDQLQDYAKRNGAKKTGLLVLNVTNDPKGQYLAHTTLPIDKFIPETGKFKMKKMFPGYGITGEIKGGDYTIRQAMASMEQYRIDHGLASPAMPFQAIVTNRMVEADTNKWVTKIFYPVY